MAAALAKTKSLLLKVSITIITNKTNKYDIKLKASDLVNADIFVFISFSLYFFILFAFYINLLHVLDSEERAKRLFWLALAGESEKGGDKLADGSPLR